MAISPVLSPNWSTLTPSLCSMVSRTFAIGVPSSVRTCRLPFSSPLAWPSKDQRHALVIVDVRIAHRAAVHHHRMIQQIAVAIRGVLQLLQEVRQQADVIAVELREFGDLGGIFAVMRAGMERRLHAAFRPHAAADVAAHLECRDAGDVGHERQRLQIEHQLDVLFERIGHAERSGRQRAGFAARIVFFDFLNAALDLAHVVQIRVQALRDRSAPRSFCKRLTSCAIQSRMLRVDLAARQALLRRAAFAEQILERHARIERHRQRLRRRRPTDGVGVNAGVAVIAGARRIHHLNAKLDRRKRRVLPELLRVQLIDGRADEIIRAFGHLRMRGGQVHGAGPEMVGALFRGGPCAWPDADRCR